MVDFTEEEVKLAFWKTFYKEGEIFFDYMGTDEECANNVRFYWEDFLEHLKKE